MQEPPARVALGLPMQLGFVVPDLDAAIRHWVSLGVGPFFLLEHIAFAECSYRGKPARFDLSVAIGQWGPVQVELIRQHDDVPSIYTRFDGSRAGGLQHVGVMTDSVAADLERLAPLGIEPVQHGSTANGIRFAYVNTDALPGAHPGGMVELIERGPAIDGFFRLVREAAAGWDGRDPLRRPG
jgi:hypothetical protein